MKPKRRGWSEGVMSEDLRSLGGYTHKKGTVVRFKRIKTVPDADNTKLTEYEWHYMDQDNYHLIRSIERTIEGLPHIKEKYLY